MKPDDPLLRILACPLDKGPLHLLPPEEDALLPGEALYNPRLRRRYPIVDGIPSSCPRRASRSRRTSTSGCSIGCRPDGAAAVRDHGPYVSATRARPHR